jgi:hypothetical protein
MNTKKKQKNSEFYKTYEELIVDVTNYKNMEKKRAKQIVEQNRRDIEYLRRKLVFV